jgi:hypothetical protein
VFGDDSDDDVDESSEQLSEQARNAKVKIAGSAHTTLFVKSQLEKVGGCVCVCLRVCVCVSLTTMCEW